MQDNETDDITGAYEDFGRAAAGIAVLTILVIAFLAAVVWWHVTR